MYEYIGYDDFLKNKIIHYFAICMASHRGDPSVMQLTSRCNPPLFKFLFFYFLHILYKTVKHTYLIYQKWYPLHIVLHELWRGLQWCCWRAVPAYLDCSYAQWNLQICNLHKISHLKIFVMMTFWKTWFFIILHGLSVEMSLILAFSYAKKDSLT